MERTYLLNTCKYIVALTSMHLKQRFGDYSDDGAIIGEEINLENESLKVRQLLSRWLPWSKVF